VEAETVRDRIGSELAGIMRVTNWHRIELVPDEVAPFRRDYKCELPERILARANCDELESVMTFWCIVSEGDRGYDVIYDEIEDRFGLAVADTDGLGVVIGWDRTLLDAFRGM
jgi:hypothetical protein